MCRVCRARWYWCTCARRFITRWCVRERSHVFQVLDHSAIYLLIAGTYTPFTLVSLGGAMGWTLFGVGWALAVTGIVFKSLAVRRFEVLSALVYLFQGWLVLFVARPLLEALAGTARSGCLPAALPTPWGSSFSRSTIDRTFTRRGIFCVAGSVAHYFAILFHIVPMRG